ncbi:DUF1294 domain-containing protein [Deinococcus sp.]|uniref:DUF1294 domain-containing protein n=1 Tax=Deinococcus sp. TaxID=47478 RepID=UPI0025BFD242|nr:DUF1294 domain-containing protein [Deinococcus sp.]
MGSDWQLTVAPGTLGTLLRMFVAWQVVWGLVAFVAVWRDKQLAQARKGRLPEATLHRFERLGGWAGSWAAQQVFRHKTRKGTYQRAFRRICLGWAVAWAGMLALLLWL